MPIDSIPISVASLPGIVAGPILRRLTRTEVSVWVATVDPGTLTLKVRARPADGTGDSVASAQPTQVGSHLWMTVLTAAAPGSEFRSGQTYEYELTAPWAAARPIPWASLRLRNAPFPTFLATPDSAEELVVAHASCRKPHGGGRDALALLMDELDARFDADPPRQPHLLLLTGDQIYADEVGHALMPRILRVAADLVGIDETDVFGPPPPIGGRGPGTNALGYTGATANHLWSFGEFVAMYLLTWSPVLWASSLPPFPPATFPPDVDSSVTKASWDEDRARLQLHRDVLPQVRKVLANVPSLMIFDDHEITDDWNIDYPWVNAVHGNAGGRRAVTNGVLAYALCQHWGNKPAAFTAAGTPERQILQQVAAAATTGDSCADAVRPLLGIRSGPLPAAPPARALRDLLAPGAIRYDIAVGPDEGWPVRIVMLDERTVREYPAQTGRGARISLAALAEQMPAPASPSPVTLVVAAAPVLGTELIERLLQPLLDQVLPDGARFADFESWSAVTANHQDLLARLAAHHPVVVLSGDVHYGFSCLLTRFEAGRTTRVGQFTSSAAKNLEGKNSAIGMFSELIMRLGIERPRATSGYMSLSAADQAKLLAPPPAGTELAWDDAVDVLVGRIARDRDGAPVAMATPVATAYGLASPGWMYTVEPVDDPIHDYDAGLAFDAPWAGWDPVKSLHMAAALQDADLERMSRMFVGLPQVGIVTFEIAGSAVEVGQELRCPVGDVEPAAPGARHVVRTKVQLS